MRSEAKTVDAYIDELDGERKQAVVQLRQLTRQVLPGFRESMKYGMPTYEDSGKVFAFASQKHYVSIYINNMSLLGKYNVKLGNAKLGKNCIRYTKMSDINFEIVKQILSEAYSK